MMTGIFAGLILVMSSAPLKTPSPPPQEIKMPMVALKVEDEASLALEKFHRFLKSSTRRQYH